MFGSRLPKNRRFNIEYYYYDPEKDEREGKRVHFKRGRAYRKTAKTRSLIWLIILLVIVIYLISYFIRMGAK